MQLARHNSRLHAAAGARLACSRPPPCGDVPVTVHCLSSRPSPFDEGPPLQCVRYLLLLLQALLSRRLTYAGGRRHTPHA